MIWYCIVLGTNSPKVREKLISKGSALTLGKAVKIAWSFKTPQAQLSAMAGNSTKRLWAKCSRSSETKHEKRTTGRLVKLSTFFRNADERKLLPRPQFTFQRPALTWSDMSVLQEAKPFCRRLQIKIPNTTILLCRTSQEPSLNLFHVYECNRMLIRTSFFY